MSTPSHFNKLSLTALQKIASKLAAHAKLQDIYLLYGDLGAGKTTFIKAFAQALGTDPAEVSSPTFNLVHIYDSNIGKLWHFDLYRLDDKNEIYELGMSEASNHGISLIEWPNILQENLPPMAIRIYLSICKEDTSLRDLSIIYPNANVQTSP